MGKHLFAPLCLQGVVKHSVLCRAVVGNHLFTPCTLRVEAFTFSLSNAFRGLCDRCWRGTVYRNMSNYKSPKWLLVPSVFCVPFPSYRYVRSRSGSFQCRRQISTQHGSKRFHPTFSRPWRNPSRYSCRRPCIVAWVDPEFCFRSLILRTTLVVGFSPRPFYEHVQATLNAFASVLKTEKEHLRAEVLLHS